jgi:hypothetical protein
MHACELLGLMMPDGPASIIYSLMILAAGLEPRVGNGPLFKLSGVRSPARLLVRLLVPMGLITCT